MEPGRKSPSSPICCSKEERCCSNALSGTGMSTSLPSVSHTLGNSARLPNQPGAHILVAHPPAAPRAMSRRNVIDSSKSFYIPQTEGTHNMAGFINQLVGPAKNDTERDARTVAA